MKRYATVLAGTAALLGGCVDMSEVGRFARESETLSATASLDPGDAQRQALELASAAGVDRSVVEDPASEPFREQQAVTGVALQVLGGYMARRSPR